MATVIYKAAPLERIVNVHFGGRIVIAEVPNFLWLNPIAPPGLLPASSWDAGGNPYALFDPIPAADYQDSWVTQPFDEHYQVYRLLPFESIEDTGPTPPYHAEPFLAYQTTGTLVVSGQNQSAADWIASSAPYPADWYLTTYNGPAPIGPLDHNGYPLRGDTYGEPADYHGIGGVFVYQVMTALQAWSVGLIVNMGITSLVAITQSDNFIPNGYLPAHGVTLKCYDAGDTYLSITTGGFIRATLPPAAPTPPAPPPPLVDVVPLWEVTVAPLLVEPPAGTSTEIARFDQAGLV